MKAIFRIWLLGGFILVLGSGTKVSGRTDTLRFLHITDTHLIFGLEDFQPDIVRLRQHYGKGIDPLARLLDSVSIRGNSRFIAITGDLIDYYGGMTSGGQFRMNQIEQFNNLVAQFPIRLFLNLGNHDIATYHWDGARLVSNQRSAGASRADWIRSQPAYREGTYYSHQIEVAGTVYRLIFLDNSYNSAGLLEKSKPPYVDRLQMEWLKEQLSASEEDFEIVFMHIPFGKDISESELYTVLSTHPTLKLILAGHEHQNLIRALGANNRAFQVQTAAFARNPNEWREVSLTRNSILVSQPGKHSVELSIALNP